MRLSNFLRNLVHKTENQNPSDYKALALSIIQHCLSIPEILSAVVLEEVVEDYSG